MPRTTVRQVLQRMIDRAHELGDLPLERLRLLASESESPHGGAPGKKSLRLEFAGKSKGYLIEAILDTEFETELNACEHLEMPAY